MIPRYTAPEMARIWTEENKFRKWLQVEVAVCESLAELGELPAADVRKIKERANFSIERIAEIERSVKHDVLAFISSVAEFVGPEAGVFQGVGDQLRAEEPLRVGGGPAVQQLA